MMLSEWLGDVTDDLTGMIERNAGRISCCIGVTWIALVFFSVVMMFR
jgi:hypothetical protein